MELLPSVILKDNLKKKYFHTTVRRGQVTVCLWCSTLNYKETKLKNASTFIKEVKLILTNNAN